MRYPKRNAVCPGYDQRCRQWRHVDTGMYRTVVVVDLPCVECPEHGVCTVLVPWAEPRARFTVEFEALVIDWLQEANISAIARMMGLSWNAIDGIMQRAVKQGLARRSDQVVIQIGVDETLFRKHHEDVTIV